MAKTTGSNMTSPNAIQWAGADSDSFDRTDLSSLAEDVDGHDHTAGKGLGVGRVQTSAVPDAAGEVRVNTDAFQWYGTGLHSAVDLDSTQAITGAKTFTSPILNTPTLNTPSVGTKLVFSDAASKIVPGATSWSVRNAADGADNLFVTNAGIVGIGVTGNTKMTKGLALHQGAADDQILSAASSDVSHGFTDYAEATQYFSVQKAAAANGGVLLRGFQAGAIGFIVESCVESTDATRSTSGQAAVELQGWLRSGTGGGSLGGDKNILAVCDYATTRFILDSDGDSHQDVGTAWTNFDEHDDIALLNQLSAHVTRQDDPLRRNFGTWLETNRAELEHAKLVTFNEDNHHFVNMSRLSMLLVGAVRQLGDRLQLTEAKLAALPGGTV